MLFQELPHDYPMIFAEIPVIFDVFPRGKLMKVGLHTAFPRRNDAKVAAFLVAVAWRPRGVWLTRCGWSRVWWNPMEKYGENEGVINEIYKYDKFEQI